MSLEKLNYEEKFFVINQKHLIELSENTKTCSCRAAQCECLNLPRPASEVVDLQEAINKVRIAYEQRTGKKLDQKYYVCNQDESYANDVLEVILTEGKHIEHLRKIIEEQNKALYESKLYRPAEIMPNRGEEVQVFYYDGHRYVKTIAWYVGKYEMEDSGDFNGELDVREDDGTEFWPEGWYEIQFENDAYSYMINHQIIFWKRIWDVCNSGDKV